MVYGKGVLTFQAKILPMLQRLVKEKEERITEINDKILAGIKQEQKEPSHTKKTKIKNNKKEDTETKEETGKIEYMEKTEVGEPKRTGVKT